MAVKEKPLPTVSYDPPGQAVMSRHGQNEADGGRPMKTARRTYEQCEMDNKTDGMNPWCRANACTETFEHLIFIFVQSRSTTVGENIRARIRLSFVGQAVCRDMRVKKKNNELKLQHGEGGRPLHDGSMYHGHAW